LWEGGFLLTARAQGIVPSHAHHAIQIVIALQALDLLTTDDRRKGDVQVRDTADGCFLEAVGLGDRDVCRWTTEGRNALLGRIRGG
jgi:hypothetical protein